MKEKHWDFYWETEKDFGKVIDWAKPKQKEKDLDFVMVIDLVKPKPKEKDLVTAMDFVKD